MRLKNNFARYDKNQARADWFIAFCDERIKSITDYCQTETQLSLINREMLAIFRFHRADMESYKKELRRQYFAPAMKGANEV